MKKETFLILVVMVGGLALVVWSFFGGGNNQKQIIESEIPQSSDTGFVNSLTNTGEVLETTSTMQEPDPATSEENTVPQKDYTEIRLMMPKYFYTPARKDFAKDLYSGEKVHINFIFIDDLNQYRDSLSSESFFEADIILFPYDWNEFVKVQTFSFQKSLKPVFDDFTDDIIEDTDTSFLPFAADPMIMYMLPTANLTGFSDIANFAYDRASQKPMSFPIFFGMTDEDYYSKGFAREYKDIMRYALMHYFTTYRNRNNEELLSARINSNVFENYDVSNLNTILSKIDISECKYFPSICFQLYDLVGLRFGFLSDSDIINTYFQPKQFKFTELQKLNFPFYQTEVPVRIRGRAIPEALTDIDTTNAVYRFLVKYMNSHDQYDLRSSTIPVFKSEGSSIIDNPYVGSRGYILTSGGNFLETLKNTGPFRQLLDYEISAQQYLKRI